MARLRKRGPSAFLNKKVIAILFSIAVLALFFVSLEPIKEIVPLESLGSINVFDEPTLELREFRPEEHSLFNALNADTIGATVFYPREAVEWNNHLDTILAGFYETEFWKNHQHHRELLVFFDSLLAEGTGTLKDIDPALLRSCFENVARQARLFIRTLEELVVAVSSKTFSLHDATLPRLLVTFSFGNSQITKEFSEVLRKQIFIDGPELVHGKLFFRLDEAEGSELRVEIHEGELSLLPVGMLIVRDHDITLVFGDKDESRFLAQNENRLFFEAPAWKKLSPNIVASPYMISYWQLASFGKGDGPYSELITQLSNRDSIPEPDGIDSILVSATGAPDTLDLKRSCFSVNRNFTGYSQELLFQERRAGASQSATGRIVNKRTVIASALSRNEIVTFFASNKPQKELRQVVETSGGQGLLGSLTEQWSSVAAFGKDLEEIGILIDDSAVGWVPYVGVVLRVSKRQAKTAMQDLSAILKKIVPKEKYIPFERNGKLHLKILLSGHHNLVGGEIAPRTIFFGPSVGYLEYAEKALAAEQAYFDLLRVGAQTATELSDASRSYVFYGGTPLNELSKRIIRTFLPLVPNAPYSYEEIAAAIDSIRGDYLVTRTWDERENGIICEDQRTFFIG